MKADFKRTRPDLLRQRLRAGETTSRCTIQQFDGTLDSSGQPDKSDDNWDNVAGMTGLACSDWSPRAGERRGNPLTAVKEQRIAILQGEHVITTETMRAVISKYGVVRGTYDILAAETYGLQQMPMASESPSTKLWLEAVGT